MSRKKHKQKHGHNTAPGRALSVFNIPIPEELRIPAALDATGLHVIKERMSELEQQMAKIRHEAGQPQKVEVIPQAVVQAIGNVATNAWRAKIKMVDSDTGEAREEMKKVYRHIEGIFEALKVIGVETIDPVGRAYDSGMALKVVSFEQTPGVSKEEIKETVKPSISWQGRLIQMGEVIVGTPVAESSHGEKHHE